MQSRPLTVAMLLVAVAATTPVLRSGQAGAQGEPEHRLPAASMRSIAADYTYAYFQGDIDPWHAGSVSVAAKGPDASIIGRVNFARRFATNGAQVEADAYGSFAPGFYAYLNIGYSRSTIFPAWRSGGEIFRSLPQAYEASLGYRQLRFGGPPVTLFTGSLARYSGNYWFSLRPYVWDKPTGLMASGSLTARRYYPGADNYIGIRAGYGTAPNEDVLLSQLSRLRSTLAALDASHSASNTAVSTWSLSYEREKLAPDRYRNHWEFGGGIRVRY